MMDATERRQRTNAWLAAQPEPVTRTEALRRRLDATHVSLAADGHMALANLRDWRVCFIPREQIEGPDDALLAYVEREAFSGCGDLFCAYEPKPALTEEQLMSVDLDAYWKELRR
jgi:hypothetical protein